MTELDALRKENRELKEELEEWRRGATRSPTRTHSLMIALPGLTRGEAKLLDALLNAPGIAHTLPDLAETISAVGDLAAISDFERLVYVRACGLRRVLRAQGFSHALKNVRGVGYTIDPINVRAILSLIDQKQEAA